MVLLIKNTCTQESLWGVGRSFRNQEKFEKIYYKFISFHSYGILRQKQLHYRYL